MSSLLTVSILNQDLDRELFINSILSNFIKFSSNFSFIIDFSRKFQVIVKITLADPTFDQTAGEVYEQRQSNLGRYDSSLMNRPIAIGHL